ncbi:MAG: T9SS type A sorting domain-containing protein [Ignavibacterium sp.]|nr:T9SS type A sorting domain-containing protein [Ignavibacterium sp.]
MQVRAEPLGKESVISTEVKDYELSANYPNPFNPSTVINYAVKEAGLVRLKVYDILGAEVAELVNETKEAGYHSIEFNASQLPSGVYIYTLQVNSFTSSKKMLLMK